MNPHWKSKEKSKVIGRILSSYKIGLLIHFVDFEKDKSYFGKVIDINDEMLIVKLDRGYRKSIHFSDIYTKRIGINKVLREL